MSPSTIRTVVGVFVLVGGLLALWSLGNRPAAPETAEAQPVPVSVSNEVVEIPPVVGRVLESNGAVTRIPSSGNKKLPAAVVRVLETHAGVLLVADNGGQG